MDEDSAAVPAGVRTVLDVEVVARLEACRLMIDVAIGEGLTLPGLLLIKGMAMAAFDVAWQADQGTA